MGCTEQRFICYNPKKRRKHKDYNEQQNNEINNHDNIDKSEENKEEIEIKKDNEENNKIEERKNNSPQYVEEDSKESDDNKNDIPLRNLLMLRELGPYLQTKNNPNFNFPEVEEEKYVGKGLRKMKGYISIIPKDELEKRRIAFWGTRVEGNKLVWDYLKKICELPVGEEKNMKVMLEANGITPLLHCINVTFDNNGEIYEIPNYCINDPVLYDLPEAHVKNPKNNKNLNLYARRGAKQVKITSLNSALVENLKENIAKEFEINENEVRMFFGGKELKNGNELWKYNIDDNCVIIVL